MPKFALLCTAIVAGLIGFAIYPAIATESGGADYAKWKAEGEFGWFGVGTAHQIGENHIYWVGEFSGTFFSDQGDGGLFHRAAVKCPGFNDLNFATNKGAAAGYCVITDTDGDTAVLSWSCAGEAGPSCDGTFTYTGGTGKYKGISGSNTFTGVTQVNHPDGTASGFATWNR